MLQVLGVNFGGGEILDGGGIIDRATVSGEGW